MPDKDYASEVGEMIDWSFFISETPSEELIYFTDCWECFCSKLSNPTIYDTLNSPHFLINEIIIELNINEKDNSKHLNYFRESATTHKSFYFLFTSELQALWNMLVNELQNPNKDVLLKIAYEIKEKFMQDEFVSYLEGKTKQVIFDKKDKEKIKKSAAVIIFEFIYRQFEIKTISNLCDKVFSSYYEIDYPNGKRILKEEMEKLTFDDRLSRLFEILTQKERYQYVVFYVKGLHLSQEETFDDVTFYNPLVSKKLKGFTSNEECFHNANYETGSNVLVKVFCKDTLFGVNIAKKQVSEICDYLKLLYRTEADYKIFSDEYLICDESMNIVSHSRSNDTKSLYDLSIDRIRNNSQKNISVIYKNLFDSISDSDSKAIKNALHFYRKGIESDNQEEKLLNLWISLENVFSGVSIKLSKENEDKTKFSKISDCLKHYLIFRYFYSCGWSIYDRFQYYFKSVNIVNSRRVSRILLSAEDSKKINIVTSSKNGFSLFDFINLLNKFGKCTDNCIFNEELNKTIEFYKSNKTFTNAINAIEPTIKNELLMIYRQRNQIVHKASYDTTLLNFYISKLQFVTTVFLRDLIANMPNEKSINNFILNQYIKVEKIRNIIKNNSVASPEEILNK